MSSQKLQKAMALAEYCHIGQKRETGDPYITHAQSVMRILERYGFREEEILIAAILHDVCEDGEIFNSEIQKQFGYRVGFIIKTLSKNKKIKKGEGEKMSEKGKNIRFLMYINRFHLGMLADPYIMFIKMADQIDNLGSMQCFSEEKKERKIREVQKYFFPIYEKIAPTLPPEHQEKYKAIKEEIEGILQSLRGEKN